MNKEKKTFDRSVCFQFFESYLEQAKQVKDQLGAEMCADYMIALAEYGLYQKESNNPMIKMLISGLKNAIDAGQEKRARAFDNSEMHEKIIKYKKEHPEASLREIGEALGCSKDTVDRVLKKNTNKCDETTSETIEPSQNLITSTSTSTSTSNNNSNSNSNTNRCDETVRQSLNAPKDSSNDESDAASPKTEEEINKILAEARIIELCRSRTKWTDTENIIKKEFNLTYNGPAIAEIDKKMSEDKKNRIVSQAKEIMRQRQQDKAFQRKLAGLDELMTALANKGIHTTKEEVIAKCKETYNSNKPDKYKWSCRDLVEDVVNNKHSNSKLNDTFDSVIKEFVYLKNQCA